MYVFSCQQDIPPGVTFSGQYFGPNIEAFQGLLPSLLVDTDLFSCFNIRGLQVDCPFFLGIFALHAVVFAAVGVGYCLGESVIMMAFPRLRSQ